MNCLLIVNMLYGVTRPYCILHTPECHKVLERITEISTQYDDIVIVNDNHKQGDEEFKFMPPHAIEGTMDTLPLEHYICKLKNKRIEFLKKNSFSALHKDHNRLLISGKHYSDILVAGFCTSMDVIQTAKDLIRLGQKTSILEDCTDDIIAENKTAAIIEMKGLGINVKSNSL